VLVQEYGSHFVGVTAPMKCQHCNNVKNFAIKVNYFKQSFVNLVSLSNQLETVFMECLVCERIEKIMNANFLRRAFVSDEKWQYLHNLLDGGKEVTKRLLENKPAARRGVLKRLNTLKAYDLVKYLEGS
jgi:hypothetical protein